VRRVFRPQALRPRLALFMTLRFPDPSKPWQKEARENGERAMDARKGRVQPEDEMVKAL